MNYKSVKSVAESLRRRWGIEMDLWQIAANVKEVMAHERVIPLIKKFDIHKVEDYTISTGQPIAKILSVIRLDQPPVPATGSFVYGEIIFPPQTFWVSNDPNEDLTNDELAEVNALPYLRGPYIPYEQESASVIKFNDTDIDVGILYSAIATDEEGRMLIPEEMVVPLATYCAEVYMKPLFILGRVQPAIYQTVQMESEREWASAKNNMMMNRLSQNRINELMNIMSSMDRKGFNINA